MFGVGGGSAVEISGMLGCSSDSYWRVYEQSIYMYLSLLREVHGALTQVPGRGRHSYSCVLGGVTGLGRSKKQIEKLEDLLETNERICSKSSPRFSSIALF